MVIAGFGDSCLNPFLHILIVLQTLCCIWLKYRFVFSTNSKVIGLFIYLI